MPLVIQRSFPPLLAILVWMVSVPVSADDGLRVVVEPMSIELRDDDQQHGLLVTALGSDGACSDVTRQSKFLSNAPDRVAVDASGQCRGLAEGAATIEVRYGAAIVNVPVVVKTIARKSVPSFNHDIEPILTKAGCNAGGCHGKLAGQNGFRLSLRAFAPEWDYEWITREVKGRRIDLAFPAKSLLLQKPTGALLHEGGMRFREGSRFYRTISEWIAARAPGPKESEAALQRLEVLPGDRELRPRQYQQLLVRAHYEGGRIRDVTWLAQFFSNDETIVSVKPDGRVKAFRAGETSVRVHFLGHVQVVRFTIPFAADIAGSDFTSKQNLLDEPIFAKLRALRIAPSTACDDQTFIRRASLDAIGTLPGPEELTAFLDDAGPGKRALLVESLLARPEFLDYWTLQLADLLQNRKERDHDVRGTKGVRSFHYWLRAQLAAGRSWRDIAQAVLLSKGDVIANPEVGYYVTVIGEKQRVEESELPDSVAQSFLGTRIGCARCHNHPLEKYTQDDFYHFAAYFSKLSLKRAEPTRGATALAPSSRDELEQRKRIADLQEKLASVETAASSVGEEPGGEELKKTVAQQSRELAEAEKKLAEITNKPPGVNQPRTGKMMVPQPLDGTPWNGSTGDPREQFVAWMLQSEYFSGAMVNRVWKHFFNVGLVEPVDDLRASNPPSNSELWAILNREFSEHGYDLKHLIRLILNSRAYQLSSATLPANELDTKFYSHYYARRLPAEVLMDAIAAATDVPSRFDGHPVGLRAIQLPESGVQSYFLSLFGRSDRVTACACERAGAVTLPQLLHLQNSDELQRQISAPEGRLATLLKDSDDRQVTDGVFLASVNRRPTARETVAISQALAADQREAVFKDLLWALLNSKEFAFNH